MKKRFLAIMLSMTMMLSTFSTTILAADLSNGQSQSTYSASSFLYDDNWNPEYLTQLEHRIYESLRSYIETKAVTGGEMVITLKLEGLSFDNQGKTDDEVSDLAFDYFSTQVDSARVLICLLNSLPYEMFWYDKMSSSNIELGLSTIGQTTSITSVSYYLPVYTTYQDKNSENSQYTLSATAASEAARKVANAQKIVDANAGKNDIEKLTAYKEAICDLVSYDEDALEILSNQKHPDHDTFYGEPFQITNVFDEDPTTNVVCEGYARAFQYLCDLSEFDDVECYSVVGTMTVLAGSSDIPGEGHMWNLVKIDGKSYIVDLTNCDTGTIGAPDYLFLKEPVSGNVNDGYVFAGKDSSRIKFVYGTQYTTDGFYYASILNLDKKYMTGSVSISGTPKIDEVLTAVPEGTPGNANLTYQWYRGDQAISGAVSNTYTPISADDVGATLKVVVSASGYEGSLNAQASSQVVKAEAKEVQEIQILSETDTSITIQTHSGEEYACVIFQSEDDFKLPGEDQWQDSGEFTGLISGSNYVIFARCKETPTHYATPISGYKYEVATTKTPSSNMIMAVEVSLAQPVKCQDLPEPVTSTDNIMVTVTWYEGKITDGTPVTGKAKPDQYYTAQIILTAEKDYIFAEGFSAMLNNESVTAIISDGGKTAVLTITFPATEEALPLEMIPINETTFPDAVFRNYVNLYDVNHDGYLHIDERALVTKLFLVSKGITDLKGIEYFPNLETLQCYSNDLTELDLSALTNLKNLSCSQCQLKELDLSKNVNIEKIACQANQITTLNLSNCTKIQILLCGSNQLTELDVSQAPELIILTCSGNQLTELDVSNNSKLQTLSVEMQVRMQEIPRNTDGIWSLDLSDLVNDWSKVTNIRTQDADLAEDGRTVVFSDGLLNPVVTYNYMLSDDNYFEVSVNLIPTGLHTEVGLDSVAVGGIDGVISGTEIAVELPYDSTLPTDADQVDIILTDHFATLSDLTCQEDGAAWTFIVTAEDGVTTANYTILVSIASCTHDYQDGKCTVCGAFDPDYKPVITVGANSVWQKGDKEGLVFVSSAAFEDFLKIQADGNDVDKENYEVKEGSTDVTLKASYLETLSVGKHMISVVSETGTAAAEFTIQAAPVVQETPQTPQTGDNSGMTLWIAGLLVMASALAGIKVYGCKKKYSK